MPPEDKIDISVHLKKIKKCIDISVLSWYTMVVTNGSQKVRRTHMKDLHGIYYVDVLGTNGLAKDSYYRGQDTHHPFLHYLGGDYTVDELSMVLDRYVQQGMRVKLSDAHDNIIGWWG